MYTDLKDISPGGGTTICVVHATPVEHQNGGFQKELVKEEDPDDDYHCKTAGQVSSRFSFIPQKFPL